MTNITVGTIGAGNIATAFARHAVNAGYNVTISAKNVDAITDVASAIDISVKAGTVSEAAACDIVLLAIPYDQVKNLVEEIRDWKGKVVIDATNAIAFPEFKPLNLEGYTSSEINNALLKGARVVKAFNTIPAPILSSSPKEFGGNRVVFYSGDDAEANKKVAEVITNMGFYAIELGDLVEGGKLQEFGGPIAGLNLLKL